MFGAPTFPTFHLLCLVGVKVIDQSKAVLDAACPGVRDPTTLDNKLINGAMCYCRRT